MSSIRVHIQKKGRDQMTIVYTLPQQPPPELVFLEKCPNGYSLVLLLAHLT